MLVHTTATRDVGLRWSVAFLGFWARFRFILIWADHLVRNANVPKVPNLAYVMKSSSGSKYIAKLQLAHFNSGPYSALFFRVRFAIPYWATSGLPSIRPAREIWWSNAER